jgi:hypothetical protein
VETAVGLVIERLLQWGHRCEPREPAAACTR